jgi:recombination protein RecA
MGVDFDIVQKSGAWYSYDEAKIAQGRDAAKKFLLDNPEVADEIEQKIIAKISASRVKVPATINDEE